MENLNLTQYIDKFLEELLMIDKSEIYNIGENGIDMKINNKLNDLINFSIKQNILTIIKKNKNYDEIEDNFKNWCLEMIKKNRLVSNKIIRIIESITNEEYNSNNNINDLIFLKYKDIPKNLKNDFLNNNKKLSIYIQIIFIEKEKISDFISEISNYCFNIGEN